jgi:hypothetical protein
MSTEELRTISIKKEVFCSLSIDGIHRWNDCPIEEVKFLRDDHRHMFGIKCFAEVNHSDRDIEFIELKHIVIDYMKDKYYDKVKRTHYFGSMSCEMIAEELILEFGLTSCEVNEDGENGSVLTVTKVPNA